MAYSPIAIVGRACVLPGALSPEQLWDAVCAGEDLLSEASPEDFRLSIETVSRLQARMASAQHASRRATVSPRGGYVRGFGRVFDPEGFEVSKEEVLRLDPVFQWTLHVAREALKQAGLKAPNGRSALFLANLGYETPAYTTFAERVWLAAQKGAWDGKAADWAGLPQVDPKNRFSCGYVAHLTAKALGLGESFGLDAACASSLYALHLGCEALHEGRADAVVAAGVNHADPMIVYVGFGILQALSPTGQSRPFDARADGLMPGEGAAAVVLKRLDDALAAGDRIYGLIRGVGVSNDGRAGGLLVPDVKGQARALRQAYEVSGLDPKSLSLLECHATGTTVGDGIELQSCHEVFGPHVAVGSLKGNIGHTVTVAGMAGLIKVLSAFEHKTLPPNRKVAEPLPALAELGFHLVQQPEPWEAKGPRRAGVNAFGFGGNNAHVVLEEWEGERWSKAPSAAPSKMPHRDATIAVVAMEVAAGGADPYRAFLDALVSGEPSSRRIEKVELALDGLRYPPKDLAQTLGQQLLILEAARHVAARLGAIEPTRTGVFVGMGCDAEIARYLTRAHAEEWAQKWRRHGIQVDESWLEALKDAFSPPMDTGMTVGTMPNIVANRIGLLLNLQGQGYALEAEELSGVRALEIACRALKARELDLALVGAVDLCCEPVHEAAAKAMLPLDRHVPGDAAVILAVMREEEARAKGFPVLAVLGGVEEVGHQGLTAMVQAAGEEAVQAWAEVSVMPDAVGLDEQDKTLRAITPLFGHAHAASGLLHVAAGIAALYRRMSLGAPGKPAVPWLSPVPRRLEVRVSALGGQRSKVVLHQGDTGAALPLHVETPRLRSYAASDVDSLLSAIDQGRQGLDGPCRLVVVAEGEAELASALKQAKEGLSSGKRAFRLGKGAYFRERPIVGELALVFPGAAAAYPGMGRELLLALPELTDKTLARFPALAYAQEWLDPANESLMKDPAKVLLGSSFLSQVHAILSRGWLGLKPQAVLGVSSGETNSVLAMGAWDDIGPMLKEIVDSGMYSREIAGEFAVAKRGWGVEGPIAWRNFWVLAPVEEVKKALEGEERVYLSLINTGNDCVIAGDADACRRVIERIGMKRAFPLGQDVIAHCPLMERWREPWYRIHHRKTTPVPGVRFYSNASGTWYEADSDRIAEALTGQAVAPVDFRRVVEAAYEDGVRVFVENGPRGSCANWIRDILGEREHLAVALDRPRGGIVQLIDALAQLLVAGVEVHHEPLFARLAAECPEGYQGRKLVFDAHPKPVILPQPVFAKKEEPATLNPRPSIQRHAGVTPVSIRPSTQESNIPMENMSSAPALPSAYEGPPESSSAYERQPKLPSAVPVSRQARPPVAQVPPSAPAADGILEHMAIFHRQVSEAHRQFLAHQSRAMALLTAAGPSEPAGSPTMRPQPLPATQQDLRPAKAAMAARPTPPESARPFPSQGASKPAKEELRPLTPSAAFPSRPLEQGISKPHVHASEALPAKPVPKLEATHPKPFVPSQVQQAEPEWFQKIAAMPLSSEERTALQAFRAIFGYTYRDAVPEVLPGPKWGRKELEILASEPISKIFGPMFSELDSYDPVVRMPMPPLLLADAVLGIDAEPCSMSSTGKLWTETVVEEDAWYLHHGYVPAGIALEMGQADLLLISWLGVDFENKGQRVYRLLGIDAIAFRGMLKIGDRMVVDINVGGYAKVGPVRLFFFNSHGWVNGELASAVRNGQTGFFTNKELRSSGGILWNPANAKPREVGRLDPPAVVHGKRAFSADEVRAFSEDRAVDCFGPVYAETLNHTRTPRIQRGLMQLIDEITEFDPEGGPWGRGYICAVKHLTDEEWFYDGHFKGDPCMPGTLTIEAIAQLGMFYAAAMGYTVGRDGWRFEPLLGELSHVRARGQTVPGARKVVYELFIESVSATPVPTMHAQGLSTVDGLRAFHGGSSGGQLIPGYPIESRVRLLPKESDSRAARLDGRSLDLAHLLQLAWGRPSVAFGERYAIFDGALDTGLPKELPRLPGPPMLLLSRISACQTLKEGLTAECDLQESAWFAQEQHARLLAPWVLLEAARQAGMWWLVADGSLLDRSSSMAIRLKAAGLNMESSVAFPAQASTLRIELKPSSAPVNEEASFQAAFFLGEAKIGSLDFGLEILSRELDKERKGLASETTNPSGESLPVSEVPLLPKGMLQMLDGVPEYWPEGGEAGLGALRAKKAMAHGSWYFTCNAFQDPHLPSAMFLEMACQALACLAAQKGVVSPKGCWAAFGASMRLDQHATIRPGTGELLCCAEVVAMADGALEGLARFYLAGHLVATVSGVEIRPIKAAVADGTIHPDVEPLADYVPAFGVVMTSPGDLVERLAAAAVSRLPGRVIVRMGYARFAKEDLWLSDRGISYSISCRLTGPNRLLVRMHSVNAGAIGELLAEAAFEFAEEFPLGPRALPPLQEGEPQGNPYEAGVLEAGLSWQVITELALGQQGASAILDPAHASPGEALHPAFIEAALQTLLPRNGHFWSALPQEQALRPVAIEDAEFFRPPKRLTGPVRLESRLESIEDGKLCTRHTFMHDNRTCAQFKAVFALTGPTPWDRLPRSAKRALVTGKGFDPGMLSTTADEKGQTVVPDALSSAPEGLWRALYGLSADEDHCLGVALREHVARLAHGHPRWVRIAKGGGVITAESASTPGLRYALLVKKSRNKRLIANAESPKANLDEGVALLRERWGITERWLHEDLFRGLIGRFGGGIIAEDPKGLAALSGRGVLYLANHQLDLESILFVIAMTVLTGSTTQVMARDEARDSYFGRLFFLLAGRGDMRDPELFALVQRQDIAGMWRAFQVYLDKVRDEKISFLVHVEGKHKERAREPVGRVSAALVDSAVERGLPIVPVRFAGSLPVEPVGAHPEFPSALGPFRAILGSPFLAEDLLRYPSKERCELVCRAINTLGEPYDRLEDELPSVGEPAWVAAVERRQREAKVSRDQAVVYCLLSDLSDPSEETKQVLALAEGRLKRDDVPQWLADFATVILGCRV